MNPDPTHPIAELCRLLLKGQVLGFRIGLPWEQGSAGGSIVPQFEDRVWDGAGVSNSGRLLPEDLLSGIEQGARLFMASLPGSSEAEILERRQPADRASRDPAILIRRALSELPRSSTALFLAPASEVTGLSGQGLRRELDELHAITWLVFLDNSPSIIPFHQSFRSVLICCDVGEVQSPLTRLVDLRGCDPKKWGGEVRAAAKRQGGEVGRSVVLRGARLGQTPWTYERFTKAHSAARTDSSELGALTPLQNLVDEVIVGMPTARERSRFLEVRDDAVPEGAVALIGGRDVRAEGVTLPGRFWVKSSAVTDRFMVREGDVLIRRILDRTAIGPRLVATVVSGGTQGAISDAVIRLRWRDGVPLQARELLLSWLVSEKASRALQAAGVGMSAVHLPPPCLLALEVPNPSEDVVSALSKLADLETWYRERTDEVKRARHAVFFAESYTQAVPILLEAQQAEGERVTAAEDSQRFDYRIRNYFPHPIALRREQLQVQPHGKERLEKVLECAEHLVHYLALCGLAQLGEIRQGSAAPSNQLISATGTNALRFDWGSSWNLLKEAVGATRRAKDPLSLPIPQLSALSATVEDAGSASGQAEAALRGFRNAQSHLHREPDPELVELSEKLSAALDDLLSAVSFLTDVPLVYVRDYNLDGMTGERRAVFDYLRGASVVFDRREVTVDRELPRGTLGLLSHTGTFHPLGAWLLLHPCEVCKRPEVFLFNRFESGKVTYVAMESGHPWSTDSTAAAFEKLLRPVAPTAGIGGSKASPLAAPETPH